MCATQRASLAGLQGLAVRLQALNALLLQQQRLLVLDPVFERLVAVAQIFTLAELLLDKAGNAAERLCVVLQLLGQRRAQCCVALQLLPVLPLVLCGLPVVAQPGQPSAVGGQPLVLGMLRSLLCLQGVFCVLRGLADVLGLCGGLLL